MRAVHYEFKEDIPTGYKTLKVKCEAAEPPAEGKKWVFDVLVGSRFAGQFLAKYEAPSLVLIKKSIKIAMDYLTKEKPAWKEYSQLDISDPVYMFAKGEKMEVRKLGS